MSDTPAGPAGRGNAGSGLPASAPGGTAPAGSAPAGTALAATGRAAVEPLGDLATAGPSFRPSDVPARPSAVGPTAAGPAAAGPAFGRASAAGASSRSATAPGLPTLRDTGPGSAGQGSIGQGSTGRQATGGRGGPPGAPPAGGASAGSPGAPPPGGTRWSARGAMWLGIGALILLIGGFGGWAVFTRIAGAVVAPGQVEVEHHRQVVQHPDGGVVEQIFVHEGQSVSAGETLIRLDGTLLRTELAIVEGQYFELLARRARLEAERGGTDGVVFPAELSRLAPARPDVQAMIDGQTSLFETRRNTLTRSFEELDKQADQVRQQVAGISAQQDALIEQRKLIGQELDDQQSLLKKGLAQAPRVLALQREAASLDGQLGNAKASLAQGESKLTEIDITKLKQAAERREAAEGELRDLGDRELELAERRRALTEQVARLDLRAPVSGIVYQLQVTTPRAVIRPADPVLYLIPQDRPLVIAARVAPINIDEVRVGQPVKLRFSAFSSRTTPEIDGVLAQVSADAVVDQASQMQYYRAEVTLPDAERAKLGDLALVPGMPAEVYIQTGERSPLAYLLKPFTDYLNRAFRET